MKAVIFVYRRLYIDFKANNCKKQKMVRFMAENVLEKSEKPSNKQKILYKS